MISCYGVVGFTNCDGIYVPSIDLILTECGYWTIPSLLPYKCLYIGFEMKLLLLVIIFHVLEGSYQYTNVKKSLLLSKMGALMLMQWRC